MLKKTTNKKARIVSIRSPIAEGWEPSLLEHKRCVSCRRPEVFGDSEQLVVFADSVSSTGRARLYLADACGNGQVSDCTVFGFAASMTDDRGPAGTPGHIDCLECFCKRAYLVKLNQYRVGAAQFNALFEPFRIGYE